MCAPSLGSSSWLWAVTVCLMLSHQYAPSCEQTQASLSSFNTPELFMHNLYSVWATMPSQSSLGTTRMLQIPTQILYLKLETKSNKYETNFDMVAPHLIQNVSRDGSSHVFECNFSRFCQRKNACSWIIIIIIIIRV